MNDDSLPDGNRKILTMKLYSALVIVLCTVLAATFPEQRAAAARPNIVVILVDDMGYGDPGCYNAQSKIPTPHIDSLARDGMRFTDAHAPGPLCHMSRYGLMTGEYPFRTKVGVWRTQPVITKEQMTIASLARSQGYRTAMVGKWHLGFQEDGYQNPLPGGPVDCGFDSFFGIRASTDIPPYFYIRDDRAVEPPTETIAANNSAQWSPIQGAFWRAGGIAPNLDLADVLPRFTGEAVKVIEQHGAAAQRDQPLMLYLAYPAPHTPWLPAKQFQGKSGASMYGDFAMMVDDQIGQVLAALDKSGMAADTLLIFTSDNGPCWYETDVERFGHDSAGGLRGMKADAWEAGHRMPFIVRWPKVVAANSTTDQTICFTDLLATFAAVMEVELPPEAGPDSFNILPVLTQKQPADKPVRRPFVMRAGSVSTMMTIRSGNWKLITQLGSGGFSQPRYIKSKPGDPAGQLYNLAEDLGETTNLYAEHPDVVTRLTAELKGIVKSGRSRIAQGTQRTRNAVDPSTMIGKVMCGYQGWFNCPGDGAELDWSHWARDRRQPLSPDNVTVDLWPDVSELTPEERFATDFQHHDGRPAEVFSSYERRTVVRHFEWMRDYDLDGIFLQRFATELANPKTLNHRDTVLSHVREGARLHGRVYAVMYDLSGLGAGQVQQVRDDWQVLRKQMEITHDDAYLHHAGKPVVGVWGIGFNDNRKYSLEECQQLVSFLKDDGCTVMLGIPSWWREGRRDAVSAPQLRQVLKQADMLSPWTVGRYRTPDEANRHASQVWDPDLAWCREFQLDFVPVVFPGFSWRNLHGGPLNAIPRRKGEFLWTQIVAAKRIGCKMIYVAMFDEVDEGTAIFKCTNDTPVGKSPFVTYEGLTSDHYLRLAGQGGRMLRGELPVTTSLSQALDASFTQR